MNKIKAELISPTNDEIEDKIKNLSQKTTVLILTVRNSSAMGSPKDEELKIRIVEVSRPTEGTRVVGTIVDDRKRVVTINITTNTGQRVVEYTPLP